MEMSCAGFTVFVIRNSTTYLLELRTEIIAHHMRDNALRCGLYLILFSTGVTVLASLPVLFIAPAAAGSGVACAAVDKMLVDTMDGFIDAPQTTVFYFTDVALA